MKSIYDKDQSDALGRAMAESNPRSNFYRVRLEHTDQNKLYCPESLTSGHPLTEVVRERAYASDKATVGEDVYNCPHCKRQSSMPELQMVKRGPFDFGFKVEKHEKKAGDNQ